MDFDALGTCLTTPACVVTQTTSGLIVGMLLFLVAAGVTLIFGVLKIVNFAHGTFYMLGGYVAYTTLGVTDSYTVAVLAGALAIFLTLGLGVALGHEIASHMPHIPEPHTRLPEWTLWLALALAPLAVAVQLRATPRQLLPAMVAGVLAWVAARGGAQWLDPELGVFVATLALGAAGNAYAWLRRRPAAVVIVPGLVMLVPGSLGLRSVAWLAQSDVLHGLKTASQMMVTVVALVGGLLGAWRGALSLALYAVYRRVNRRATGGNDVR